MSRKCFLVMVLALVLALGRAEATERADACFQESNLNLCWCFNGHWSGNETEKTQIYYKGIAKMLNEYIKIKVQEGKLKNRKFEIQLGCIYITGSNAILPYEISKSKKGYNIILKGEPNLEYLVKIVNYFSSENWQPFVTQSRGCLDCLPDAGISPEKAIKTFNSVIEKEVGTPGMDFFNGKRIKVYVVGDLEIYYKNDNLNIYLNGNQLDIDFRDPLPVKLQNRYVVISADNILVYENNNIIAEEGKKMVPHPDESFRMETYRKWIDFKQYDDPFMSYSYEKNRFYKVE